MLIEVIFYDHIGKYRNGQVAEIPDGPFLRALLKGGKADVLNPPDWSPDAQPVVQTDSYIEPQVEVAEPETVVSEPEVEVAEPETIVPEPEPEVEETTVQEPVYVKKLRKQYVGPIEENP